MNDKTTAELEAGSSYSKDELLALLQAVKDERAKLEHEKNKSNNNNNNENSDIVSINVGGQVVIQVLRETLCLVEGSTFASMFSERWQDSIVQDEEGRIFTDHDPEMILCIVNYLRVKKIEDPYAKPIGPPTIAKEKEEAFLCLLKYFGMDEFFYPSQPLPLDLKALPASSKISVSSSFETKKHRVSYSGSGFAFLGFTPALEGQNRYYWKCTIVSLSGWLFLGLIGNKNASKDSYIDATSYGWAWKQYVAGKVETDGKDGWTEFAQEEVLHFRLEDQTLTMHSKLKKQSFSIPNIPKAPYLHFNLHAPNTVVELEPLSPDEIWETEW